MRPFFQYLSKFLYIYSGKRLYLLLLISVFIISSIIDTIGIALIGPFLRLSLSPNSIQEIGFLAWVYNKFDFQNHRSFIIFISLILIAIFILKGIFYLMGRAFILKTSLEQKRELQLRLTKSFIRSPYEASLDFNSANLISMIMVESAQFALTCAIPFFEFWANLIVVIVLLLLVAKTDAILAITSLLTLFPVVVAFFFLARKAKAWGKTSVIANRETIKAVNHGIGGLKEAKLLGCESFFEDQIADFTKVNVDTDIRYKTTEFVPRATVETFLMIHIIGTVCVFQIFLQRDMEIFISSLTVFAFAAIRLIPSLSQLLKVTSALRNSSYILDKFYVNLKSAEARIQKSALSSFESKDRLVGENQMAFSHSIELKNITYRYPKGVKNAVQDVSLRIDRGKSIAVIGKSGSGKTTLVDIVLGLLEPQSGDIEVDGISAYKDIRAWQNLLGYIPQAIFLMDDTIEKNIAFGIPEAQIDAEKLRRAIEIAQLEAFIDELPDGIYTTVGDRGVRLSGGQRQRIGIARAIYHEREVLVLDEATSALDGDTEKLVSDSINALAGDKTLIIIAHRMSTIQQCDLVYRLEAGRVIQEGQYKDVVINQGS